MIWSKDLFFIYFINVSIKTKHADIAYQKKLYVDFDF